MLVAGRVSVGARASCVIPAQVSPRLAGSIGRPATVGISVALCLVVQTATGRKGAPAVDTAFTLVSKHAASRFARGSDGAAAGSALFGCYGRQTGVGCRKHIDIWVAIRCSGTHAVVTVPHTCGV